MKNKRNLGIEALKRRYGVAFVTPWLIGVLLFVLVPLVTSFMHAFSIVTLEDTGLEMKFAGLKHFKYLINVDPWYSGRLSSSISGIFTSLPIIVALSLIFAIILNQKFKGRMMMRAIFFLPVIFASEVVMGVMQGDTTQAGMVATLGDAGNSSVTYMEAVDFSALLLKLNLPTEINNLIDGYLDQTFNLIWNCGVQTLLFIAGLQSIPSQLYEVGKVEGATPWESFWYITMPMLSNVTMLVVFYTMIELFITKSSLVLIAIEMMQSKAIYDESAAMLWLYFMIVGAIMGLIFLIYRLLIQKKLN